ncbi:MAG: carboxypeptidase regulatory-like domain-containing protein, partial [Acidobacteria bacterium]|nr:carboxypeptidase regulatory-like domain-containing protein [Acidobacteriota bacterium]
MRGLSITATVLFSVFFLSNGFAQVINATLSGTVSDASGALIPGVEITATQTGTGVISTVVTNESGTYRFASLQPGPYQVRASLPGFQPQTFQLTLGTSQQIRQNFTLQVGAVTQAVEVSVAADQLLTAQSSSVGTALGHAQTVDLPLVSRNVMDLATTIIPGVRGDGQANTTFAGIPAIGSGNVGISMDGATMNTGRHTQGLKTATFINPDMVDEVRVVVAAVDVEGRGSAQIQMRTRSGTNQFHGGLTWNIRNSALNANSWSNNRQGITPLWYNRHQYTATLGGPIIRNKTFFFGMFDGQDGSQKQNVDAVILTDTARQGIFRFFPGVNNGNADATPSGAGASRIAPVVNRAGNPLDWTQIPGATGPMQSFSVFGDALNPGDPFRRQTDRTGYIARLLSFMPRANAFNGGDGLNTATHRWVRRTHRLTGTWIRESHYSDNNQLSPWPQGFGGEITEYPRVTTAQLTSTLSPALLNEFRFGYRRTTLHFAPPYHASKHGKEAYDCLPQINGYPTILTPTLIG